MAKPEQHLRRDQLASLANDIALAAQSIQRLSAMLVCATDQKDVSALASGIDGLAVQAGALADLVCSEHGGNPLVGDFAKWGAPDCLHPQKAPL